MKIAKHWSKHAHQLWLLGQKIEAIQATIEEINRAKDQPKFADLSLQIVYYLYFIGDFNACVQFLTIAHRKYPEHLDVLKNLAVCLSRNHRSQDAILHWKKYLAVQPTDYLAYDSLCSCYADLQQYEHARLSGQKALSLKHEKHHTTRQAWQLPAVQPSAFIADAKPNVISFSLWGQQARYIHGVLDNALARFYLYPDWKMRVYLDDSVPQDVVAQLKALDCEIIVEPPDQLLKNKLSWRFKVANDLRVGRFLIRDVDSVLNIRERKAVDQWIVSERWFHVMRDWWSHTDLILAGMWGGVAGVLPNLSLLLKDYTPNAVETPNIDQWFLRDCVWQYIHQSCWVHDRCFNQNSEQAWPSNDAQGNAHVGQDIYAADRENQARRIAPWLKSLNLKNISN